MRKHLSGSLFLYLILAGIILALPAVILISSKTVITLDTLFNIFGVMVLFSALQYKWVLRITSNQIITFLYILLGSSTILMALFLALNFFIPSGPERNEDHTIESVDYVAGNVVVTFKDGAYEGDPGMRRFDQKDVIKPPVEMIVRYTTREGLFGFPVLIERKIR